MTRRRAPRPPRRRRPSSRRRSRASTKIWHRTLGGPLAAQLAHLTMLARGAIIFELDEGCDGTSNQTLVVVKAKQVSAVLAQTATCTE
jgi:hypothetical protein